MMVPQGKGDSIREDPGPEEDQDGTGEGGLPTDFHQRNQYIAGPAP